MNTYTVTRADRSEVIVLAESVKAAMAQVPGSTEALCHMGVVVLV